MKRNKIFLFIFLIFFGSLIFTAKGYTFAKETHRAINEYAAQRAIDIFSLDSYLKSKLGFLKGTDEIIEGIEVYKWLGDGGEKEDEPDSLLRTVANQGRSNNHFHNPLLPWNEAGLNDTVLGIRYTGQSSILWSQNPDQNIGGKWSWQDARKYFYTALTGRDLNGNVMAATKKEREKYFADTFRAIGQQMHLVQDASVPSHARNDIHILFAIEGWIELLRNKESGIFNTWITNAKSYDKSIFNLSQNASAPIPISRIIDTDQYTGYNPEITTTKAIGLIEYANANFLSEDTAFRYFPYPNWDGVEKIDYGIKDPRDPSRLVLRQYYKKVRHGEINEGIGYRLATVGFLKDYSLQYFPANDAIIRTFERPALDSEVYRDYASLLIPKAVGYSAGLLNYFFRGEMDMVPDDATGSGFVIENKTDESMNGIFELFYDTKTDERKRTMLATLNIPAKGKSTNLPFTPPSDSDAKEPDKHMLVFRGKLGNEEDAVAGKTVNLKPPVRLYYLYKEGKEPVLGVYGSTCRNNITLPVLNSLMKSTEISEYIDPQPDRSVTLKAVHQMRHKMDDLDYYLIEVSYLIEEWYGVFRTKAIYILDLNKDKLTRIAYIRNLDEYPRINVSKDKKEIYIASFSSGQQVYGSRINVDATISTYRVSDNGDWRLAGSKNYQSWYKFGWVDEDGNPIWNEETTVKDSVPTDIWGKPYVNSKPCMGSGCGAWGLWIDNYTNEHSMKWNETFTKNYHFRRNNATPYYTIETKPYMSRFDSDSGSRTEVVRDCTDRIGCPGSPTPCSGEGETNQTEKNWHITTENISFMGYTTLANGDCTKDYLSEGKTSSNCGGARFETTQKWDYKGHFSRGEHYVTMNPLWIGRDYWPRIKETIITEAEQQKHVTKHSLTEGIPGRLWDVEPTTTQSSCNGYCNCEGCPQGAYYSCYEKECLAPCWKESTDPMKDEERIWQCKWDCSAGEAHKTEKIYIFDPYSGDEIPARFLKDDIFFSLDDVSENIVVEGMKYGNKEEDKLRLYRNGVEFGENLKSCSGIPAEDMIMLLVL